jgi:DNA repair protein RAD57
MPVPSIEFLTEALSKLLPDFVEGKLKQHKLDPTTKLVRLVIIDALGELFHSSSKTSTQTLVERSRNITEISSHLHSISSKYSIVVLVLNEVVDAFDRGSGNNEDPALGLSYAEQSRWFGRAHSVPGEERKEASLGLVWANQVNARIMLSRTGRRRFLESGQISEKRQKMNSGPNNLGQPPKDSEHLELIRRMSIVFSSVSAPRSLDYIVDVAGITVLAEEEVSTGGQATSEPAALQSVNLTITLPSSQIAPLDVGSVESAGSELSAEPSRVHDDEDEWDVFWEKDQITEEMYLAASLSPQ